VAGKLDWVDRLARQRLGLRQPSAAIVSPILTGESGRGLPQSKTSRNISGGLAKHCHSITETALAGKSGKRFAADLHIRRQSF